MIFSNLKNTGEALISTTDRNLVEKYSWYIKNPHNGVSYIEGRLKGKKNCPHIKLHRLILNVEKGEIIDHLNRNTLDNRRENLRIVSFSENNLNCSFNKLNKTGRTGVIYRTIKNRSPRFVGKATINGKTYSKMFSIEKYGYDEARRLAEEYRLSLEEKFNILTEKMRND